MKDYGSMFNDRCSHGDFPRVLLLPIVFMALLTFAGCAASRSEIKGAFPAPAAKNVGAEKVSVFFLFRQMEQRRGMDASKKLKAVPVRDFPNIFRDSLTEITNIGSYATDSELPADVYDPKRRQQREELKKTNDYTLELNIVEETSFKEQCLSGTVSLVSLSLIPTPFSWDYSVNANLVDRNGKLVASYQRSAELKNWVSGFLIFAYPFYPVEGKREEIYSGFLHDIFRLIESEKALKKL